MGLVIIIDMLIEYVCKNVFELNSFDYVYFCRYLFESIPRILNNSYDSLFILGNARVLRLNILAGYLRKLLLSSIHM